MKKVLIVDDEVDQQHNLLIYQLNEMGIIVLKASNGLQGFEIYQTENPDLVISDTNMPQLSGPEMVKKIIEVNPQAAIISCSDYLKPTIPFPEGIPFIQKPVRIEQLRPFLK